MRGCIGFTSYIFSIQLLVIALGWNLVAADSTLGMNLTPYNLVNETTVVFNYTDGSPICMEPVCAKNQTYFPHFAW